MFETVVLDVGGEVIDPAVLAPSRPAFLVGSRLPLFAAVLGAKVESLAEADQLELGAQIATCRAMLDWRACRAAASFAWKDAGSPVTAAAAGRLGGPVLRLYAGPGTPECSEFVTTEIGLAFGCSERTAADYVAVGLDLRFRLPATNSEFGGGRIGFAHARVISAETRQLSQDAALELDPVLAEAALTRTPARLRALARRLVAKADPAVMAARARRAYEERSAPLFPVGDGQACLPVRHDLAVMAVIDDRLDAFARQRRRLDPDTPFAAHRADAAAHLLLGQHPLTGQSLLTGHNVLLSTVPDPLPSADPATGSTVAWCAAGGRPAGEGGWHHVAGGATPFPGGWPARTAPDPCPAVPAVADPTNYLPARTELRVTMTADTLLGLDDATCELEGFGPITAERARQLALQSASTILRRVFTDPADDSILFLDTGRYRFSGDQREAIRAMHPISTFPGATTPAGCCDLDHLHEYQTGPPGRPDPPGQTMVANAQPLGRWHHRIRTHGGWQVRVDPDDPHTFHWTSPYGRPYASHDHHGA